MRLFFWTDIEEKKKENSTGLLKAYYSFMSKLTGKKSLSEMQKNKIEKK